MSVHRKANNAHRTFWHSGMLLILHFVAIVSASQSTVSATESQVARISVDSAPVYSGFHIMRSAVNSVTCDANGGETEWSFNGDPITDFSAISTIGRLECMATSHHSGAGIQFKSLAFVTVTDDDVELTEEAGDSPIVSGPEALSVAPQGSQFKFQCKTSSKVHSVVVMWYKNGVPITKEKSVQLSDSEWELSVGPLTETDSGNYGCMLSSTAEGGDSWYQEGTLFVTFAPVFTTSPGGKLGVEYGKPLSLGCQARAWPPAVISWQLNDSPLEKSNLFRLSDDGTRLEIDSADIRLGGNISQFKCLAVNEVGTAVSLTANVSVNFKLPQVDIVTAHDSGEGSLLILEVILVSPLSLFTETEISKHFCLNSRNILAIFEEQL